MLFGLVLNKSRMRDIMWLSKDERRLLAGYYSLLGGVDKRKGYEIFDLTPLLEIFGYRKHVLEYGNSNSISNQDMPIKKLKKDIKRLIKKRDRIKAANSLLIERKLVNISNHQHVNDVIFVELTLQGYDLGSKYASIWKSSNLLYHECRKHWLWIILSFIAGVIAKSLIDRIMNG